MKILCVSPSYFPAFTYGGPIFSLHALNKALVQKGVQVTVYTTNVGLEGKVPINEKVNLDGVEVIYFPFVKLFEVLGTTGWQFSRRLTGALRTNMRLFDCVYILGIWNYPCLIAAYYARKYRTPYILSPRGHLSHYAVGKKFWKKWPYYHLIAKRNLRGAVAIHYTTEDEAYSYHPFLRLKNKMIIIPNGVDLLEFRDLPEKQRLRERYLNLKNKKLILFLGRINWNKGLDILIKAFNQLAKDRHDVHLLIVGNDEAGYIKIVKRWIKDYGLEDSVTFTGMLLGQDKLEAYAGCDLFVLPSYSENFGMSVIEAMACGLPIIISNKVGIYQEVKKNNAGVVIDCNEISLYQAMKSILDNTNFAEELSFNGRKMVKIYYNIDVSTQKMIEAYRDITMDI